MPAALQGKWANAVIVRHIVVVALEYIEFVCMRLECLHLFIRESALPLPALFQQRFF